MSKIEDTKVILNSIGVIDAHADLIDLNSLDIELLRELMARKHNKTWVNGHFDKGEGLIDKIHRDIDGNFEYSVIFSDNGIECDLVWCHGKDLIKDPGELVKELWEK